MHNFIRQIFYILGNHHKKKLILLLFLLLVGAFFEMIGLALLIPLISLLVNSSSDINIFKNIHFLNLSLIQNIIIPNKLSVICFFILLIFLFKIIFFTILNLLNSRFINSLSVDISNKIFKNYIFMDYSFFLKRNSSQLIQNTTIEVNVLCYVFFRSLLIFLIELTMIFSVVVVLILLNPNIFFAVLILYGSLILVFNFLVKNFLNKISVGRQFHQLKAHKSLQEGIRDIKNIKISAKENFFLNFFQYHQKKYADIEGSINFLNSLPKHYLEFFGVVIFILGISTLSFFHVPDEKILIVIGVFAAATIKLLPSINRIIGASTNIRYGKSALNVVCQQLKLKPFFKKDNKVLVKNLYLKKFIYLENLSFKYPGEKKFIFKNLNIKIPANKIVGIVGKSGSGKTTLIDLISGILRPTKGRIMVDHIDAQKNVRAWQNNIGYVSQTIYLIDDSIKKNVAFGIPDEDINIKKIYLSLNLANLSNFIKKLPRNINSNVGELGNNLSGGQKQRLALARLFYQDSNFLILDEATNSLDKDNEDYVMDSLKKFKNKKTIIIICHNSNLEKQCDIIINLDKIKTS